ncbi:MAG: response regulator transcription factor [Candidatus Nanopelagicales bacterium]
MSDHIWLVEDDDALALPLVAALRSAGLDVERTADVAQTVALSQTGAVPDLVLLDLGLPDGDGIDLARRLRAFAPSTVIVVLTARTEESDVIVALDAGADDYLTKPYRLAEIQARIRAHLRRQGDLRDGATVVEASGVKVDLAARTAEANGTPLTLRAKEFELLADLVSHAGEAVRREDLMSRVWDQHWDGPTKTLDMHVSWLRRKLADAGCPDVLTTMRGVGYRFERR